MQKTEFMDKEAIIKVEVTLLNAMKNGDIPKLDELIHADLLFIIPTGQTLTKAMDLDTYSSGNMKIKEISATDQRIHIVGDNAVVTVTIEMTGTYFEYVLDGKYRFIRVWKSVNEKWKLIAGSSTPL